MQTPKEIAEKLAESIGLSNWVIGYDDYSITLHHTRPTSVVSAIEVNLSQNTTTILVGIERFTVPYVGTNEIQLKLAIEELIDIAVKRYETVCKRLKQMSLDLGDLGE